MFDPSDQEIYEAVMELKCVQESSESTVGIEGVGGKVVLTRTEALQAAWILQKYMEVSDSTFARKFKTMLGAFGRETHTIGMQCTMQDTKITDHFPCKQPTVTL